MKQGTLEIRRERRGGGGVGEGLGLYLYPSPTPIQESGGMYQSENCVDTILSENLYPLQKQLLLTISPSKQHRSYPESIASWEVCSLLVNSGLWEGRAETRGTLVEHSGNCFFCPPFIKSTNEVSSELRESLDLNYLLDMGICATVVPFSML